MTSAARYRYQNKLGPNEDDVTGANEDDVVCCCFKSKSKPRTQRVKSDPVKETPEEQGKKGIQNEHSNGSNNKAWLDPHTGPSPNPRLDRDRQRITEKMTYEELDHLEETKIGAKQLYQRNSDGNPGKTELSPPTKKSSSHPWPTDWENNRQEGIKYTGPSPAGMPKSRLQNYSSEDEKQKSDVQKEEVNNESDGDRWPDLTKKKGKGNNGSNGGTRSDPTKKVMSSTFEHAGPPPREEKESNLRKYSYEDPYKDQHKDAHKREYNQENHKNTRQDLSKKESTSPEQSVEPKRKGKQNETNRLGGIDTNHDHYNLNSSTTTTSTEEHRKDFP